MKIRDKKTTPVAVAQSGKVDAGARMDQGAAARPGNADRVDISAGARELSKARKLIDALPEVRAEKVDGVKGVLQNGTYAIDPDAVAVRIIERAITDAVYARNKG
ncbi:MAG: flagellar biosynthesis anti-sigma factor FlgM [Deltaproteobacteria bacterium]|nr:flagellar biosynthesis anti-sigma factor FlgM [Deltaproteobacteria bacterium]